MKTFPLSKPILLPLAPSIAGVIADYLQSMAQQFYVHTSPNCDNVASDLSSDRSGEWKKYQQSVRLITTSPYQYVSTIAHQLAAKSSLTSLEICQQLHLSGSKLIFDVAQLEIHCWYNDAGYLYFQLTPETIDRWLNYIHDLPLKLHLAEDPPQASVEIATYAHARCCSLLKLAQSAQLLTLTDNWQIIEPNWSMVTLSHLENRQITGSNSIFEHLVEDRLIHALMTVLDRIYLHSPSDSSFLQFVCRESESEIDTSGNRPKSSGKVRSPNWSKLAIDLAQSWLEFYRYCRIFGDTKSQNPRLAIARCGLTAISRRYLQVLLENYLGVRALVEY